MAILRDNKATLDPEKEYIQIVSTEHRKKFAQFFTPFPIAKFMANWILGNKNLKTVLDPAFGLGIFARALRQTNRTCLIKGFEIDSTILEYAEKLFENDNNSSVQQHDYMFNDWENHYDGIICNPPYFKFHDYENKKILKEIELRIGLKLSGFTNLYALFLLKSAFQLNEGGRAAYIIPSEFLNSDYGKQVKAYLIQNQLLRYIIIFDFEENVFDDALTTASILLFANDNEKSEVEFINIKTLQDLSDFEKTLTNYPKTRPKHAVLLSDLNPEIKWRAYYQTQQAKRFKNLVPFSGYGKVVRGIATGSNEFFTFNRSKSIEYGIAEKYLLPCITKSADVSNAFFTKDDFKKLKKADKFIYLLNATEPKEAKLKKYLKLGEADDVHKKFLTSKRNPWHALEKRPPSPIWVSVFNRNGLRFIYNEAGISNLTTFHCIYLNTLSAPKVDLLFAYLLTEVSRDIFNDNRREYGNGLQKFEPNDINGAMMVDISLIDKRDEDQILKLSKMYRESELQKEPNPTLLKEINSIFERLFVN